MSRARQGYGGSSREQGRLAGFHLVAVLVAEQVQEAVRERPAPLGADDLRAEHDVAERTRNATTKWMRMFRCVRRTWMIPSNA